MDEKKQRRCIFAFVLLFAWVGTAVAAEYRADVKTLYDFKSHETDLTSEHKTILDVVTQEVIDARSGCVRVVGHSAKWRGISDVEYCKRSLARARNVASYLQTTLGIKGNVVKVVDENQALLGDTETCVGRPLIKTAGCPVSLDADTVLFIGARSTNEPVKDNMTDSTGAVARANRAMNRRVEVFVSGNQSITGGACKSSADATINPLGQSMSSTRFSRLIDEMPASKKAFMAKVTAIAKKEVNMPELFDTFYGKNDEYEKPIKYKKITEFAKTNFFNHTRNIRQQIKAAAPKDPSWLKHLRTVMLQSGADRIDPYLALAITTRESGGGAFPKKCQKCIINTASDGGLDNLFHIRKALKREGLIPKRFIKSIAPSSHHNPKFSKSGDIRRDMLAAFTFATVGHSEVKLLRNIGHIYHPGITDKKARYEAAVSHFETATTPLARKIWTQIALGGSGYMVSFLKHFKNLNLPLDAIRDIPNSVNDLPSLNEAQVASKKELLRRANVKQAKKYYNAVKIGVIAEAFQRLYESQCETDQRNNLFLM